MKSFWSVIGVILVGLGVTLLHSAKQISTEYNDVSAFWGAVTVFAGAGAIYLSARSVGHEKHRGKYKTQPDLTEGVYVVHAVSKNNRKQKERGNTIYLLKIYLWALVLLKYGGTTQAGHALTPTPH